MAVDAASGAVHSVDEVAYDAIQKLDAEILKRGTAAVFGDSGFMSSVAEELTGTHGISADDAKETLEDIADLHGQGLLWSEDPFEQAADEIKIKQSVLKAICLHVAHGCNMDCEYCFAGKGDYSGKSGIMSAETAIEFLEFDDDHAGICVRIADAPVLEGAVSAAVSASAGDSLEEVIAAAEEARGVKKLE